MRKILPVLAALAVPLLGTPAASAAPGPVPLTVGASGANGAGTALVPGIPCARGGSGDSWHDDYTATLPAAGGRLAPSLPSELRLHVDVHADPTATTPQRTYSTAFLAGGTNQAVLANARGSVRLNLTAGSGTCADTPVAFDGTTATATGSWSIVDGSGAYEGATGTGTFSLQAAVAPGADNPFNVTLIGSVDALDPSITVAHVRTFWGNLGLDYLNRVATSVYRFTNTGTGPAYAATVTKVLDTTTGATASPPAGLQLGDLAPGESIDVAVRHKLALLGPCALILLGCRVTTQFTVSAPDALDVPATAVLGVTAVAPDLPPPL